MRIAVDARFLESDEMPGERNFTKEVFDRLSTQHSEHEFILLTNRPLNNTAGFPQNVSTVTITLRPSNILLYKWWYDVRLPLALKKMKADIFIATYGACSTTVSIPQVLVVTDLAFLQKNFSKSRNGSLFYKKYTSSFIKKAKAVVTLSDFVKEELATKYKQNKSAIQVIGSGTNEHYKPVEWEEREGIKEQLAEGCEYFVFTGRHTSANFVNVLKAFSIFKKWQKTNMKLVIAGTFDDTFTKELEKLKSYKYRQEVVIKNNISDKEMSSITAGSYATIFSSYYEGFAIPVLHSLKCEVPVITSANSSMSEIAGEAALYADPDKPTDIAEQMKIIFRDEQLRNKLVEATKVRSQVFNWDKTAALLWKVIEENLST